MQRSKLMDAARFYVERAPDSQVDDNGGEILNDAFQYSDAALLTLRALARIRIVKSHRSGTPDSQLPHKLMPSVHGGLQPLAEYEEVNTGRAVLIADERGIPVRPSGVERLGRTDRIFITATSGRQVLVRPPRSGWAKRLGIVMPDQLPQANASPLSDYVVSIKGVGSPFAQLTTERLSSRMQIVGLTGYDADHALTQRLTANTHDVVDMYGCTVQRRFIPGRHLLLARPLRHLRAVHAKDRLELLDMSDDQQIQHFPLLQGENRPHALIFANWSPLTYRDIEKMHERLETNNTRARRWSLQQGREQLAIALRSIYEDLYYHPDFHVAFRWLQPEKLRPSEFIGRWMGAFVVAQSNKDFMESQIVGALGLTLANRHSQNYQFGGEKDFDQSYAFEHSQEYASGEHFTSQRAEQLAHHHFAQSQRQLFALVRGVSKLLTGQECTKILAHITEQLPDARKTIAAAKIALSGGDASSLFHIDAPLHRTHRH